MNILVIGNGFDLAHGLPTKYGDFLDWIFSEIKLWEKLKKEGREIANRVKVLPLISHLPKSKKEKVRIDTYIDRQVELWDCINDNIWIDYFFNNPMYQKDNWIDFESEISNVIKSLDDDMKPFGLDSNIQRISNVFLNKKYYDSRSELTYKMIRNILLENLNKLTRALEIYLCEYVERIKVTKLTNMEDLKIDHVLSFNYTNTFSRLYKIEKRTGDTDTDIFDYIHGKADINNTIESNNMVLGIDEYLLDDRKNYDVEFIAFKKFYQRIYKGTGCRYKEWVDEIKEDYAEYQDRLSKSKRGCPKHNLYILGHSLGETDGDIFRDLILHDNVHTTIFYHTKEELGKKIANLVKVIGQDELIRRTGGSTKTIEFKLQKEMEKT